MKVLHIGSTGKLGRRVVVALLAEGHQVVAYVRSANRLSSALPQDIVNRIEVVEGDGNDSTAIASALRQHACDAVINTAGTREPFGEEQTLPKLVAAIASAAITVGTERGRPLQAWFIGGFGSLHYPGTQYQIQDYMPAFMTAHHKGTEQVLKATPTTELRWSLLCVAMMFDGLEHSIARTTGPELLVGISSPPAWQDHWIRRLPLVGTWLNLLPVIPTHRASYQDVAALLSKSIDNDELVGELVGYKYATL